MATQSSYMLHRIESWGEDHVRGPYVDLSFETEHHGIWQCKWTESGLGQFTDEPQFHFLLAEEQTAIKQIAPIVFYFTHGEISEDLSGYDS